MKILITGGTGFVGTWLSTFLLARRHHVVAVGRRPTQNAVDHKRFRYISADTTHPGAWQNEIASCDLIINLAGRTIFKRWTPSYKTQIIDSRILTTRHVVQAIPQDAETVLISASAVGYYGERGEDVVAEGQPAGNDFLADVCRRWETEAFKANEKGIRVVTSRFGIVLGRHGGALQKMMSAFRAFVGGPMGSGRQWFPWIHLEDLASAILFAATAPSVNGPLNFCSPNPVRNRELADVLGDLLNRPSFMPTPAFMLRLAMGEFGDSLLASIRAVPEGLLSKGFDFKFPDIREALQNLISD